MCVVDDDDDDDFNEEVVEAAVPSCVGGAGVILGLVIYGYRRYKRGGYGAYLRFDSLIYRIYIPW